MRHSLRLALRIALAVALALPAAAQDRFDIPDPAQLVVTTERYVARFAAGTLIGLDRLPDGTGFASDEAGVSEPFPQLRREGTPPLYADGSGRWTRHGSEAQYSETGAGGGFTLRVRVDPVTGDLLVSQTGYAAQTNVRAVAWGIAGLDVRGTEVIVPAHGGCVIDETLPLAATSYDYPHNWEFQLAIVQRGDAGFAVWSEDTSGRFKQLDYRRTGSRFSLAFETENPAPFHDKTEACSVVWRLNVHQGDWRVAAGRYREWMRRAFGLTGWEADASWTRGIYAMVIAHGRRPDPAYLARLAQRLDPAKTLLYVPNWRAQEYDVLLPDCTPADWTPDFVAQARSLGFRVLLHVNLPGISPRHPLYREYEFLHVLDPTGRHKLGWYWAAQRPVTHAFINPASSRYREQYVERMRALVAATGADALHLDISAPMWNDGNGLVEGLTYGAGVRALHRELKDALPGVVFGGENINELSLLHERFYQVWMLRGDGRPHPIRSFLCAPFAAPVGYLGLPNPDTSPDEYRDYQRDYESWGVLPTAALSVERPAEMEGSETVRLLSLMAQWQKHELRPDFDTPPAAGTVFRWRGEDGTSAVIERTVAASTRLRIGREIAWERIRGATAYRTPLEITGWPARDGDLYTALDPEFEYQAVPGRAEPPHFVLHDWSEPAVVRTWRCDETAAVLELALPAQSRGDGESVPEKACTVTGRPILHVAGAKALPAGAGSLRLVMPATATVVLFATRPVECAAPVEMARLPYTFGTAGRTTYTPGGSAFGSGGIGAASVDGRTVSLFVAHPPGDGQTLFRQAIRLDPAWERPVLRFIADVREGALTNGVGFELRLNGDTLWRWEASEPARTEGAVPLHPFAGSPLLVEWVTDALGDNGYDWAQWIDPRITDG